MSIFPADTLSGFGSIEIFAKRVREVRPDLSRLPITLPSEQGYNALTIFVGNEAFKTPLRRDQIPAFRREAAVHCHLQGKVRGPIPEITSVHINEKDCFFGMTRLEGEEATLDVTGNLTAEHETHFAQDLADMMNDVRRAFSSDDIRRMGIHRQLPAFGAGDVFESLSHDRVIHLLGPDIYKKARIIGEKYAALSPLPEQSAVVHGDLTTRNILFNRERGRLTGLLDFGGTTIRPVEYDLMRLTMPLRCLDQVIQRYAEGGGHGINLDTVVTIRHAFILTVLGSPVETDRAEAMRHRMLGIFKRELADDAQDLSPLPSRSLHRPGASKPPPGFEGAA